MLHSRNPKSGCMIYRTPEERHMQNIDPGAAADIVHCRMKRSDRRISKQGLLREETR